MEQIVTLGIGGEPESMTPFITTGLEVNLTPASKLDVENIESVVTNVSNSIESVVTNVSSSESTRG